jgi:bacteriocin-like protein
MSSLLIKDLSHQDGSCSLSKNEMKHIYGGECYLIGRARGKDGTLYDIYACRIP